MEDTRAGQELIEMGRLQEKREVIIDFLRIKLGRMDEGWREELNALKTLAGVEAFFCNIRK